MKEFCKKLSEKPWVMPVLIAVLTILLYLPCFHMNPLSDGTLGHTVIVRALQAGNNWGRQALVGNTDFPALQSLLLLGADSLCNLFGLYKTTVSPLSLLVSLSLAAMLAYFIRAMLVAGCPQFIPIPIIAVFLIPATRISLKFAEPSWIVVIPLSAMTYHIVAWSRTKSIRNMVMAAAHNGLLCLCGLPCALAAIATAVVFYIAVRKDLSASGQSYDGMRSLLWSTTLYCIVLRFLWNWLVMGDAFFGMSDIAMRFKCAPMDLSLLWSSSPLSITVLVFIAPLIIICTKTNCGAAAKCVTTQMVAIIVSSSFSKALKIAQTGILPMAVFAIMAAFVLCIASDFKHKIPRTCCILALALCTIFSLKVHHMSSYPMKSGEDIAWFPLNTTEDVLGIDPKDSMSYAFFTQNIVSDSPTAEDITECIDSLWPLSRVMLYGLRLPIRYPDTSETRFVARLDFQEDDLLKQAQTEQLHILVPPPDGIFYPAKGHPLGDIHENGRPWLLLEKTWGGWQLWRVVVPPKDVSNLDVFR